MKKTILILATTLLLGVFYSCSSSDEKLSKEVSALLSTYAGTKAEVKDGIVTISGSVENELIKSQIAELLQPLKGVKSIVNKIEVPQKLVINSDKTISSTITSALSLAGFNTVQANVVDGVVTLTGDLKRSDLIKVMQAVNASSPKRVDNQLNIK